MPKIKKTKNFIILEYISYAMTLDCKKKIEMQQNGEFLKKKNQNFGLTKLYFLSNHKTGGSLYGKTNTQ